jgi:hypothetical protein
VGFEREMVLMELRVERATTVEKKPWLVGVGS